MICMVSGCTVEIWRQRRAETDIAAAEAGWRFAWDIKAPLLSTGTALCPAHADQASKFQPATTKAGKK